MFTEMQYSNYGNSIVLDWTALDSSSLNPSEMVFSQMENIETPERTNETIFLSNVLFIVFKVVLVGAFHLSPFMTKLLCTAIRILR